MKQIGIIKISFLSVFILLGFNVFGDTIVCCNSDTLTLAYEYDDILYTDSCDIQLNDVLVISQESDVFIQIIPVDTSFNFWLSRYVAHHCPKIPCSFNNYVTKISEDGIYRAYEYDNIKYQTYFEVIIGDSSDMSILMLPAQGYVPVYNVSINNDFENYNWSNGSSSNYSLIDQPGNYNINATNHCGHTFENNIYISDSSFVENQFYTNQKTGTNVNYIDLEPDSSAHYYHGGNIQPYKHILFDINEDNIKDLNFYVSHGSSNAGYSAGFFVTPLNGCEVLTINNPLVAMNIDEYCVINNYFNYSAEENIIMFQDGWTIFSLGCSAGLWQESDNYLGFKMPVNNDTLYGWMHISFFTSWGELSLIIDDYAYTSTSSNNVHKNYQSRFSVYPNPFLDNLKVNTHLQNYSITLLDVFGKAVYIKDNMNGNHDVNLESIPSGIYFLLIESEGFKQIQKIVK